MHFFRFKLITRYIITIRVAFLGQNLLRNASATVKDVFDLWRPRPLVASRNPIMEEGSFISCCSHPMHAACKLKYGRQLKSRVDHMNR